MPRETLTHTDHRLSISWGRGAGQVVVEHATDEQRYGWLFTEADINRAIKVLEKAKRQAFGAP